jgi:hypothetical protein
MWGYCQGGVVSQGDTNTKSQPVASRPNPGIRICTEAHLPCKRAFLPIILISIAQIPRHVIGECWDKGGAGFRAPTSKSVSTWISRSLGIPRLTHMDNFSLLRPKLPSRESPIIRRPTYPGMMRKMENQNDRKEWNERWLRQIALWQAEVEDLAEKADALMALIELAISQIKQDPPE